MIGLEKKREDSDESPSSQGLRVGSPRLEVRVRETLGACLGNVLGAYGRIADPDEVRVVVHHPQAKRKYQMTSLLVNQGKGCTYFWLVEP